MYAINVCVHTLRAYTVYMYVTRINACIHKGNKFYMHIHVSMYDY